MPLKIYDSIVPGGSFPVAKAKDINLDSGMNVEEAFAEMSVSIPVFDLGEMGIGTISITGGSGYVQADTAEIMAALEKGPAAFVIPVDAGEGTVNATAVMNPVGAEGTYQCISVINFFEPAALMVIADSGMIAVALYALGGEEKAVPVSVDLSGYESGTVAETYSDGSTMTYSFEFDSDGNPTKITDSNGNETVLIW